MAYQVLARKWRPNRFSELVGQDHVVTAISNALDNNRLHHAYLFTGTRGVGKTTIARIFSKSLNCETGMSANPCGQCGTCLEIENGSFVDLLEIDAASRTKVEDTRELLDNVQYKPTRGEFKVYLIDEVHMLSKHSFNALLKTLEEPPPHVKFLLATTDPQKLPVTILSRCLQFNLKALSREQISQQLEHVLSAEDITFETAGIAQLARAARGSMRDALSLTDQAIAQGNGNVSQQIVTDMLGLMDKSQVLKLVNSLLSGNAEDVMALVEQLNQQAIDFENVLGELMSFLHQIALTQFVPEACKLDTVSAKAIYQLAKQVPAEQVQLAYQIALQGKKDIPFAAQPRVGLEMTLLRILAFQPDDIAIDINDTQRQSADAYEQQQSMTTEQGVQSAAVTESMTDVQGGASDRQQAQVDDLNDQQANIIAQAQQLTASESPSNIDISSPQHHQEYSQSMPYEEAPAVSLDGFTPHLGDNAADANHVAQNLPQEQSQGHYAEQSAAESSEVLGASKSTASLLALKQTLDKKVQPQGDDEIPGKKSESSNAVDRIIAAKGIATEPQINVNPDTSSQLATGTMPPLNVTPQGDAASRDSATQNSASQDSASQGAESQKNVNANVDLTPDSSATSGPNTGRKTSHVAGNQSDNQEQTLYQTRADETRPTNSDNAQYGSADNEMPPWESEHYTPDVLPDDQAPEPIEVGSSQNQPYDAAMQAPELDNFDPMAHQNETYDVEVDFDVPAFLENGEKVTSSEQLDTWSQLIEQMQVTALTKQLALHSAYEKNDQHVVLKLLHSKPHLNTALARNQLQQALSNVLQQDISVSVELTQPINTPFAVQKTINAVRLAHATEVANTDENIQRIQSTFAARIVEDTIKPR